MNRLPHEKHFSPAWRPPRATGLATVLLFAKGKIKFLGSLLAASLGFLGSWFNFLKEIPSSLHPVEVHMQADTVPAFCSSHTGVEKRGAGPKEGRELLIGKQPRVGSEK